MSDSLSDIMKKRGYDEPPEVARIKEFVLAEIGITPKVSMNNDAFFVSLPSASAVGTIRFKLFQLQRELGHSRKIILKIAVD